MQSVIVKHTNAYYALVVRSQSNQAVRVASIAKLYAGWVIEDSRLDNRNHASEHYSVPADDYSQKYQCRDTTSSAFFKKALGNNGTYDNETNTFYWCTYNGLVYGAPAHSLNTNAEKPQWSSHRFEDSTNANIYHTFEAAINYITQLREIWNHLGSSSTVPACVKVANRFRLPQANTLAMQYIIQTHGSNSLPLS